MSVKRRTQLALGTWLTLWFLFLAFRVIAIGALTHFLGWSIAVAASFVCAVALGWFVRKAVEESAGVDIQLADALKQLGNRDETLD